VHLIRRHINP